MNDPVKDRIEMEKSFNRLSPRLKGYLRTVTEQTDSVLTMDDVTGHVNELCDIGIYNRAEVMSCIARLGKNLDE